MENLGESFTLLIRYQISSKKKKIIKFYLKLIPTYVLFSDISERNNDYSDTLDFRRG